MSQAKQCVFDPEAQPRCGRLCWATRGETARRLWSELTTTVAAISSIQPELGATENDSAR